MKKDEPVFSGRKNRRSFLKNGMVAAGAMTAGVGLVSGSAAFADEDDRGGVTKGDIATANAVDPSTISGAAASTTLE